MPEEGQREGPGEEASVFPESRIALELLLDEEFDRLYERLKREEEKASASRWAGVWRRSCAFFVDSMVLLLLSMALFYLSYVGYRVGLAAHRRPLSWDRLNFFIRLLIYAWLFLVSGYFVLLHGMEGQTIGKWLLGLRVVSANQEPITYRQAVIRWIGTVLSALSGLGFLWILWNRERRAWHDLLAGTWVIREGNRRKAPPQIVGGSAPATTHGGSASGGSG